VLMGFMPEEEGARGCGRGGGWMGDIFGSEMGGRCGICEGCGSDCEGCCGIGCGAA
jgi:hypothetical protein